MQIFGNKFTFRTKSARKRLEIEFHTMNNIENGQVRIHA